MNNIPTVLQKIVAQKQKEIEASIQKTPSAELEYKILNLDSNLTRPFFNAISKKVRAKENAVIAEIKKASPSKGIICNDFDATRIAKSYEENGATCLSVLTDEQFFQGSVKYLKQAKKATNLPILRKDFIIDEYQILESKAMGADCILLIAACLTAEQIATFTTLAYDLGMDVLAEVHNLEELDKLAGIPLKMIGINNRNLHTFETNLLITIDLAPQANKDIIIVTESGIADSNDVAIMNMSNINAFLVGESFMKEKDPGAKLKELFS